MLQLQGNNYGFRCLVVGYETDHKCQDGLKNLEMELAYLGGTCAAALMRRNLPLSMPSGEDPEDHDIELTEESAAEAFEMHTALLSKGFALERPPSVHQVGPWSSLVVGDEGCIVRSRKLLCLCQTPKNYAAHAWHYSIHV